MQQEHAVCHPIGLMVADCFAIRPGYGIVPIKSCYVGELMHKVVYMRIHASSRNKIYCKNLQNTVYILHHCSKPRPQHSHTIEVVLYK